MLIIAELLSHSKERQMYIYAGAKQGKIAIDQPIMVPQLLLSRGRLDSYARVRRPSLLSLSLLPSVFLLWPRAMSFGLYALSLQKDPRNALETPALSTCITAV